eukprot:g4147.t1
MKMRMDIIWPVVWGTCFIGGVILGSTGPVNVLAFGSSSPKLRGSDNNVITEQEVPAENAVEQRQLQMQQDDVQLAEERNVAAEDDAAAAVAVTAPATTNTNTNTASRALGSFKFDAGFGEDRPFEAGAGIYGGPSTVAQRVHALNGGLWGPNEEEEREIALELARLREEEFEAPTTSSSSGSHATSSSGGGYYSFSFDFEADETSYSYDYESPFY